MDTARLAEITAGMQNLVVVDSVPSLVKCLGDLSDKKQIFAAAKSPLLGRGGSISILQLSIVGSVRSPNSTFLIDICTLGRAAFDEVAGAATSLREILASRTILKVTFDCRNLADALYNVYGVLLENTKDMQCMHMLSMPTARYLTGFYKVLTEHGIRESWHATVDGCADLRSYYLEETPPAEYAVRPLGGNVMMMCLMDILWYDDLWVRLQWDLPYPTKDVLSSVQEISEERLNCRMDPKYKPQGPERKVNDLFDSRPWLRRALMGVPLRKRKVDLLES